MSDLPKGTIAHVGFKDLDDRPTAGKSLEFFMKTNHDGVAYKIECFIVGDYFAVAAMPVDVEGESE